MIKLRNKIYHLYYYLESKIAFYPSVITLIGILFTGVMFYAESMHVSNWVVAVIPQLEIKDPDTAKTLLSTIIGVLISLMVFSFSMVMVVLNQASSNFSPRLLPGLISNKNHQYVLGIYLATIVYGILIFLSVESGSDKNQLPIFSVLMAILFTILCLALFIYFIHSISQAIQVNNIVKRIYLAASNRIQLLIDAEKKQVPNFNFEEWHTYKAEEIGYYGGLNDRSLRKLMKEKEDLHIKMLPYKGKFIQKEEPLFATNKSLEREEVNEILSCFQYTDGEFVNENYVLAFKQLTEIAVKAMSPGINDPGTAVLCFDYLTVLLNMRMQLSNDMNIECYDDQYLLKTTISFEDILSLMFVEFRRYCSEDLVMILKMNELLQYLQQQAHCTSIYQKAITKEVHKLKTEALGKLVNEADKRVVENSLN
ncbi:DUF2254 domain-containing protein [Pustulibacterium marinum]|nr:DUF2254 domain-containing protein [Pustulibacterium marinum]